MQPTAITARGSGGLLVELDHAELRYDGRVYTATMRRRILNTGPNPVTRYLIRISVDRHPGDPEASNRLYRRHPLTFDETRTDRHLRRRAHDMAAQARPRLVQGGLAVLRRCPRPENVWGTETSTTAEPTPLHTPITRRRSDDQAVYEWGTADPPLNARYRLEWRFKGRDEQPDARLDLRLASLVPRPLRLEVEHTALEGRQVITVFCDGLARLVAHEIDHLYGRLHLDRMRDGIEPIGVEEYKGTGQRWEYEAPAR